MLKVFTLLARLGSRDDRGITAVEYALLLALVAIALIAGLKIFGPALGGEFSTFAGQFP